MLNHRTLLLDASYQPIRDISWMKAVTLDFSGKVFVLETYDTMIRTPSISIPVPAVVVLRNYHGHRPNKFRYSKRNVFIRDDNTCQYCGLVLPFSELTLDHVLPSSRGGKSEWSNVVAACAPCNHKKADRKPDEVGMVLRTQPSKPSAIAQTLSFLKSAPPEWKEYLPLD